MANAIKTYQLVRAATQSLTALLKNDPHLVQVFGGGDPKITDESPAKLVDNANPPADKTLSVYLFRVVENAFLKNQPKRMVSQGANGKERLHRTPLALTLHYLVTPLLDTPQNDQDVLGRVMQLFHDNPVLQVDGSHGQELRIVLSSLNLEDYTKLWSAFMRPLRLSVPYEVRVLSVASEQSVGVERVSVSRNGFLNKVEKN